MKVLKFKTVTICVQYNIYRFSMLSLGRIVILGLVVANLFMHSLLFYLAVLFFTLKVFLHENDSMYKITYHTCTFMHKLVVIIVLQSSCYSVLMCLHSNRMCLHDNRMHLL